MKTYKHFTAMFFVTLLFLFKVAGLHALSHHQDDSEVQHCEMCEISTAVNLIPVLEQDTPTYDFVIHNFVEKPITYQMLPVTYANKYLSSHLFARPPPQTT